MTLDQRLRRDLMPTSAVPTSPRSAKSIHPLRGLVPSVAQPPLEGELLDEATSPLELPLVDPLTDPLVDPLVDPGLGP